MQCGVVYLPCGTSVCSGLQLGCLFFLDPVKSVVIYRVTSSSISSAKSRSQWHCNRKASLELSRHRREGWETVFPAPMIFIGVRLTAEWVWAIDTRLRSQRLLAWCWVARKSFNLCLKWWRKGNVFRDRLFGGIQFHTSLIVVFWPTQRGMP